MTMRINYQKNQIAMVAVVLTLMAVTLYMALAFPYSLLHFKQSETTELKAVIIIGRHGEVTPSKEAYFDAYGEEPPQDWFTLGGPSQLTNTGKERMYLLGKFLKLHYYERLLQGNPRKLYVRAENSDKTLESAQALLAGLNPPRDKWAWLHGSFSNGGGSGADSSASEFSQLSTWQPKAIHTMPELQDDMLSSQSKCLQAETFRATWKNSTRYVQLLNEFRHDLQVLRQNTGLEFEDDLEMLTNIDDQLRARNSFDASQMPSWYTSTLAQRLAHIADVTAGCRFSQASSQRLFVGRLLDTIVNNIFAKIRSDLTSGVSLLNNNGPNSDNNSDNSDNGSENSDSNGVSELNQSLMRNGNNCSRTSGSRGRQRLEEMSLKIGESKLLPPDEQIRLKLERQMEPSMFVYMTDKQHLTALMNGLQIYSSQPHYGALLMIELHHDANNQVHFLRLFTVNSASHNVLPEPVRVNPIACLDAVECSPQQFEQNIRHLTLDKQTWQSLCSNTVVDKHENDQLLQLLTTAATTTAATAAAVTTTTTATTTTASALTSPQPTRTPESTQTNSSVAIETTNAPIGPMNTSNKPTMIVDNDKDKDRDGDKDDDDDEEDDDESVILGPTERSDAAAATTTAATTTTTTTVTNLRPTSSPIGDTSTIARPAGESVSDSIHLDKLDESLVVGPIKTTDTTEPSLDETSRELGGLITEQQVVGPATTTISSVVSTTRIESDNSDAESATTKSVPTTTTKTTFDEAGDGANSLASAETTTTTTTTTTNSSSGQSENLTTLASTLESSIDLDSVLNDPGTNEIVDDIQTVRGNYFTDANDV